MILFSQILFAQDRSPEQILSEANKLYTEGSYDEAIIQYQKVIGQGYVSSGLYYNLGNAFYKINNIPAAILHYEKAHKFNPGDEDIEFNLNIARLKTVDKIEPLPKPFFEKWFDSMSTVFTSTEWSVAGIAFTWLFFFGGFIYLFALKPGLRKIGFTAAAGFLVLSVFSYSMSYHVYNTEYGTPEAVIFSPSIYVKSSPDEESTDLFILHEGTKVKITDQLGEWQKIRLADGNVGWIPESSVRRI
ncbi:MAG: tetratricopeptide repeat protein [Bacteroidota bacterium]